MEQNKCPFQGTTKMKLGLNAKPSVHCIGSSLSLLKNEDGSMCRKVEKCSREKKIRRKQNPLSET